jgi:hypothetical protein
MPRMKALLTFFFFSHGCNMLYGATFLLNPVHTKRRVRYEAIYNTNLT